MKILYPTRAIITRSFYTDFLKSKNGFKGFFLKIPVLCMVSIQEPVIVGHVQCLDSRIS